MNEWMSVCMYDFKYIFMYVRKYVCMYVERDSLAAGGPRGESQKPAIDFRDWAQGIQTTTFTSFNAIVPHAFHTYIHINIHTYMKYTNIHTA